jgi:hypothetical protein
MTIDAERRARDLVARATDDVEPSASLDERVRGLTTEPGRGRHRWLALGAAAALVIAIGVWRVAVGGDAQVLTPVDATTTTTSGTNLPTDHWTELPQPPAAVSSQAAVAVPGGAVFWEMSHLDQTSSDLSRRLWHLDIPTGQWRSVVPDGAPEGQPTSTWWPGDAVWTGHEVVSLVVDTTPNVSRITPFDTIRWHPGDHDLSYGTSPRLDDVSGRPYNVELTSMGDSIAALVSVQTGSGATRNVMWSYDLDADEWTRLPDPQPVSDRVFSVDWTGEELVVLAGRMTNMATWYDGLQLLRLRPGDDTWREASRPPEGLELSGQAADAAWDGQRLVVVTYAPSAATWDPTTDTWNPLPVPPLDGAEDYPRVMVTDAGGLVTQLGSDIAELPTGISTWTALPAGDLRAAVVSGDVLIGQGPRARAGQVAVPEPPLEVVSAIGLSRRR